MTAICSGGTSSPKPGVAETVIFSAGALASLLNNKGGAWATIAAPLLGVLSYEATSLCSTDPPTTTQLTSDEYAALLHLSPWDDLQSAIAKLADIATATIWYEMCKCDSVSTPSLPATVLQPPPSVSTPGAVNSPCFSRTIQVQPTVIASVSTSPIPAAGWKSTTLFPDLPTIAVPAQTGIAAHNAVNISGLGWTSFGVRVTKLASGAAYCASSTPSIEFDQWSATGSAGVVDVQFNYDIGSGPKVPSPQITTINTAKPAFDFLLFECGTTPDTFQVDFWAYCGGTPGAPTTPCAADPVVLDLLGQLMQLLLLVQRQGVPFGTIDSTVHSGLSGNGSISVTGLIGAVLELTTIPQWVGSESGSPDVLFEAGWTNWESFGRFTPRERISASPQLLLPSLAGVYNALHYSLSPGVVATITELRREF